jgi:hypothetical protein
VRSAQCILFSSKNDGTGFGASALSPIRAACPRRAHRLLIDQTVSAEVTVVRDEAGESRSSPILVAIAAQGVDQPTAERLTTYFRDHLPG